MMTEAIMIVVDNSHFVPEGSHFHKAQLEAIRLYCRAKIKSNSKTTFSLATLGLCADHWPARPNSDIEHLLTYRLEHIPWGGDYNILLGLQFCQLGFAHIDPLDKVVKRRMLVFVGGPCHGYLTEPLLRIGKGMKTSNIALDVVSFPYGDKKINRLKTHNLRSFVASANNNKLNNSHFARFPLDSSVFEVLVSSKILSLSQAQGAVPYMEEEVNKMKLSIRAKKKSLRRNRRKKNHDSQQEASSPSPSPSSSSSYSPSPSSSSSSSPSSSPPSPPSPPRPPAVVTLPAHFQVPQKYKNQNQLLFGSFQMHQLVDVLSY